MNKFKPVAIRDGINLKIEENILEDFFQISISHESDKELILHWGLAEKLNGSWSLPSKQFWPTDSSPFGKEALRSPFLIDKKEKKIVFKWEKSCSYGFICFAVYFPYENKWENNNGKNFLITLPLKSSSEKSTPSSPSDVNHLMRKIIESETESSSWTLMHRFNLCYDLIAEAESDCEKMALLFVWLRFSAIRQLDWQRNYNTKPKDLSHAQYRITKRLAEVYIHSPLQRDIVRLMMKTLGPGGEGQRIRDEILNIMHRHHIKEVSGHFMEEWHQKLHNNTTPDDIIICDAYIKFLKNDGNLNIFYETLKSGGVTKERLRNFERPIVTDPDFIPHLKDALIHDFTNYLKLFKSIHAGTDLESAIHEARVYLNDETKFLLSSVWKNRFDTGMALTERIRLISKARQKIINILNTDQDAEKIRTLLYLDNALEELIRLVIEGNINSKNSNEDLLFLTSELINNLLLVTGNNELRIAGRQWETMTKAPDFGREWSLQVKSVKDRIARVISYSIDSYYTLFQEKAIYLGEKIKADKWTISLFSEEVIRGRLDFVLSMLFHQLDPILRKAADLGDWEIVSPGTSKGKIKVLKTLKEIQGISFETPIVLIVEEVGGDEEIPEGVTAVITPNAIDIVSHVAVRVRNTGVLFATCHARKTMDDLKSKDGETIELSVTPSGDVVFSEIISDNYQNDYVKKKLTPKKNIIQKSDFKGYAFSLDKLEQSFAGGKSYNLKILREKLPAWIKVPSSVVVPFGVFEKVQNLQANKDLLSKYKNLIAKIEPESNKILNEIRKLISEFSVPEELMFTLADKLRQTEVSAPDNEKKILSCIKEVWASVWNERAYHNRKRFGIDHENISMAVLIQEIVEADYSFVIHTTNPSSKKNSELYAEIVIGLGETLVANYPGRAMSFSVDKTKPAKSLILTYPSKSAALYGTGLIFRSDSNAEDLTEYSGAGLYDSVTLNKPTEVQLDYLQDPLTMDKKFRDEFTARVAEIGIIVEKLYASPQDIEGVYSKGNYYVVQTRPQVGI